MSEELQVAETWGVGDTFCLLDVVFPFAITGFTPMIRGRGKRQALPFADITGTVEDGPGGVARYDFSSLNGTADYYLCQVFLIDGSSLVQTSPRDFAVVFKDVP
jgi:hypothetical protein